MGIYISSKGEEKNTEDMAYPYLQSALAKAQQFAGDPTADENIKVLEAEIAKRDSGNEEQDDVVDENESDEVEEEDGATD